MNNSAAQPLALANDTSVELLDDGVDSEDSTGNSSAAVNTDLVTGYLDALRCGVLLSG